MLKVQVRVEFNKLPQIRAGMAPGAERVVRQTTVRIERDVKRLMQEEKSGQVYVKRKGKLHTASAPGEAPAVDTSHLINSIQTEFPQALTGILFTNAEYAAALEFGSIRIEPRPFMVPAAEGAWEDFVEGMRKIVGG